MVQAADLVLAGNGFLAGMRGGPRRGARPRASDPDLHRSPIGTRRRQDPRRTATRSCDWSGSGSSSTLRGIESAAAVARTTRARDPESAAADHLRSIPPRFDPLPIEPVPWSEAGEATGRSPGGDIGISWVPDDLWSRGKCGLEDPPVWQQRGCQPSPTPSGVHSEIDRPRTIRLPSEDRGRMGRPRSESSQTIRCEGD